VKPIQPLGGMKYVVLSWNPGWLPQVCLCIDESGVVLIFDTFLDASDWVGLHLNGSSQVVGIHRP
jgi:hypothetical protein